MFDKSLILAKNGVLATTREYLFFYTFDATSDPDVLEYFRMKGIVIYD